MMFVGRVLPLFLLVLLGFVLSRAGWPRTASDALTRFVFSIAVPTLLFRPMSDFGRLPRVDARLLIAFFGGCLVVYGAGRLVGASPFRMDGVTQSVFAMGGIFSNTVLLGIPLAKVTLGDASLPAISLVVVFNSLTLWTLVSISIEMGSGSGEHPRRHGVRISRAAAAGRRRPDARDGERVRRAALADAPRGDAGRCERLPDVA
jgi:predicted permease